MIKDIIYITIIICLLLGWGIATYNLYEATGALTERYNDLAESCNIIVETYNKDNNFGDNSCVDIPGAYNSCDIIDFNLT